MNDKFSSAGIRINVDVKDANRELGNVASTTEKALANMRLSAESFTDSWGDLTKGIKDTKRIVSGIMISQAFYTVSMGLTEAATAALAFSKNMETAAISMEYFVEGANKAAKAQAFLREMNTFAARTPFSTGEAISLSKYMQAVGVSMGTTKDFLRVITDTAAATGATEQNLQRITFALGQMMTKGRIANEEIRQLANANIPIYEILQEQLGLTGDQISNIGKHWVSADKAIVAILTGLENRYQGAADKVSDSFTGMVDTISDNAKIISQIAGSGVYDSLAGKITNVRDALDRYREIATVSGSAGLFRQVLLDMDSTGKVGTQILALVGNTRQLTAAIGTLYTTAAPIRELFGDTLYASISMVTIGLTGLTHAANQLLEGLGFLDSKTGHTASQLLSIVFITYKATSWLGLLGQGAIKGAWNVLQLGMAVKTTGTAFLGMNASVWATVGGLATLVAYAVAAYSILGSLSNTMAGLDSTKSSGNILPDDYMKEFEEYEKKMAEYNAAISKYQEDFNKPFTEIGKSGTDSFEDIEDASKKAAKAVRKDWLAAFDEVYTIPDNTGIDKVKELLPDLGASLMSPSFKFPDIKSIPLEMPKFNWKDVYSGSPMEAFNYDSGVFKTDWWKGVLPAIITGAILKAGLGHAAGRFNNPNDPFGKKGTNGSGGGSGGGGAAGAALNTPEQNRKILHDLIDKLKDINKEIAATIQQIENGADKYERLEQLTKAGNKSLTDIHSVQVALGNEAKQVTAAALQEGNRILAAQKISQDVRRALSILTEGFYDLNMAGDLARKEFKGLTKAIETQYKEYIMAFGDNPELNDLVAQVAQVNGLEGRMSDLVARVRDISKQIALNNGYAQLFTAEVEDLTKLSASINKELTTLGLFDSSVAEAADQLKRINKVLHEELKLQGIEERIAELKELIDNKDAIKATGAPFNYTQAVSELDDAVRQRELQTRIVDNLRIGVSADMETLKQVQKIIDADNKLISTANRIGNVVDGMAQEIKAIDRYSQELLYETVEGRDIISRLLYALKVDTSHFDEAIRVPLETAFKELYKLIAESVKTGIKPVDLEALVTNKLITAVKDTGAALGATEEVISQNTANLLLKIGKASSREPRLEKILADQQKASERALKEVAKNVSDEIVTTFEDNIYNLQQRLQADFTKVNSMDPDSLISENVKQFNIEAGKLYKDYIKLYPEQTAALGDILREEISAGRDGLISALEKLAGQKNLRNSGRINQTIALNRESVEIVTALAKDIKALDKSVQLGTAVSGADVFGEVRTKAPTRPEMYSESIKAGYLSVDVVKAGVFDPERAILSAGNIGAMFGQDAYGESAFSSLIGDVSSQTRILAQLPPHLHSMNAIARMAYGRVAESALLAAASNQLLSKGISVTFGPIMYNELRTLQAQYDALMIKNNLLLSSLDAKMLFSTDTLNNLLNSFATYKNGIYTIQAKHFKEVVKWNSSIAWQLAGQASILSKTNAHLAVLDANLAGIPLPDLNRAAGINPATTKGKEVLDRLFEAQAYDAIAAAQQRGAIVDNLKIIKVTIPKAARDTAEALGAQYKLLVEEISRRAMSGTPVKELLKAVNSMGDVIGDLGSARYDSKVFKAPRLGESAVNSLIDEIVNKWNTRNTTQVAQANAQLQNILENLTEAINKKGVLETEPRNVNLGTTSTGLNAIIENRSAVELISIKKRLEDFSTAYKTRDAALTTALDGMIKQLNRIAESNDVIALDTVIGQDAKGVDKTFSDLLWGIKNTDKALNGVVTSIQRAASSMLDNGPIKPVNNPYGLASLADLAKVFGLAQKVGDSQVLAIDETSGIIQQFVKLKDVIKSLFIETEEIIDGIGVKIQSFGYKNWFTAGKATPGTPGPNGTQYYDDAAKFFVTSEGFQKTFSVSAQTISKAMEIFNKAATAANVASTLIKTENTKSAYADLVKQFNIENPTYTEDSSFTRLSDSMYKLANKQKEVTVGLPESKLDTLLSAVSLLNVFSTRSGAANTIKDYFKMAPEEQMLFGQEYISNADWRKGAFGGGLIGRGGITETLAEAILKREPGFFKGDLKGDMAKEYLKSQLGTKSPFDAVVDYIIRSGDTTSDTAKTFYSTYGRYLDEIVKPAYGMNDEWYSAAEMLLTGLGTEINTALTAAGMSPINKTADIDLSMKPFFDNIIQSMQDTLEEGVLATLNVQREHNTSTDNPLEGDWARVFAGALDPSSLTAPVFDELLNEFGVSIEAVNDKFSKLNIDSDAISDEILGWTQRLPQDMTLDLSPQEIEILATAGIQINGDGTVTFMKAMNANTSGTERELSLTIDDVAGTVIDKLKDSGLDFDFSGKETTLDLSLSKVSSRMQSAMFKLNKNLSGQVSKDMEAALAGLGTVLDSGYFRITNKAVLSGELSISEYIAGMGNAATRLSPEVLAALKNIDNVIAQGGEATRQAVAEWADGIVIPSPIKAEELTPEIQAAFSAIGVTFEKEGDNLMMVINRLGNQLQDGMTLIPQETWDNVSDGIVTALEALGVTITEEAGYVMVDLSTVLDNGVNDVVKLFVEQPDKWNQIPAQVKQTLADAGLMAEDGMLVLNTNTLNGMVRLQDTWYQYWDQLAPGVIAALDASKLATEDGLITIEKLTAETQIPANLDEYVIQPFDDLPKEIRDRLIGGDDSVAETLRDTDVIIKGATEDAFVGMVTAVQESMGTAVKEAESGANSIAAAIAEALSEARKLDNISINKQSLFNKVVGQKDSIKQQKDGTWTVIKNGYTYEGIIAPTGFNAEKLAKKRAQEAGLAFASGGLIETDGMYRAGEQGRIETVLPLENRRSMRLVGSAIANALPTRELFEPLQQVLGMQNAGVKVVRQSVSQDVGSTQTASEDSIAQKVLEYVLPVLASRGSSSEELRPIYVGTLVADERGLKELNRKMKVIDLQEGTRRA